MKDARRLLSLMLIGFCALFAGTSFAQPYFIEPQTCISANPALSLTGYKIAANNTVITSIEALGDLEIIAINQNLPTGSNVTVTVRTRNKGRIEADDCNGYFKSKEQAGYGFGKGVIRVHYGSEKCISFVDQHIYKIFDETPPINGPSCIAVGETVTYYVCPILTVNLNDNIGIDQYFWNEDREGFPPGLTELYRSSDNSSLTFKVTAEWAGGRLHCRFGRCNRGASDIFIAVNATASLAITVNNLAVQNGQQLCIPTSSGAMDVSATGNNANGYTYIWSTDNSSWSFGANGTATATSNNGIHVPLNINESAGKIFLTTVGGCDHSSQTIEIRRSLAAPLIIRRADTLSCISPGSVMVFMVGNDAGTANVGTLPCNWTLPAGWTIIGNSSASVITALAGATGGIISVSSSACTTSFLTLALNVKPGTASAITGASCIIPGSSLPVSYSVPPVTGADHYTWLNTAAGWTGASNTSTIVYLPSGNTVGAISVQAWSGACFSDTVQKLIDFSQTAATNITTTCIPSGTACSAILTATGGAGTTYVWSIPPGLGSPAVIAGNPVAINTAGITGFFPVSVTTTGCSNSVSAFIKTITIAEPDTLIYIQNMSPGYDILSVSNVSGCVPVSYCWRQNNTGVCVGTGQSLILQNGNAASYTVEVNYGSCSVYLSHATRYSSRPAKIIIKPLSLFDKISIAPNPAREEFILFLPPGSAITRVQVFNTKGEHMLTKNCVPGNNHFKVERWPPQQYIVQMPDRSGKVYIRKLIIAK